MIGIVKAYVTRVGAGPFPTEDLGDVGERAGRSAGSEFGTITGRKRRCGWFDAVLAPLRGAVERSHRAVRHQARRALGLREGEDLHRLPRGGRDVTTDFPPHQSLFHEAEPVYEELDGWMEEIDEAKSFEDLPKQARAYVERMARSGRRAGVGGLGRARARAEPAGADEGPARRRRRPRARLGVAAGAEPARGAAGAPRPATRGSRRLAPCVELEG